MERNGMSLPGTSASRVLRLPSQEETSTWKPKIENIKQYKTDIISPNQSASVPGRSILTNISSVRDIIQFANDRNLPTAIISLDQSKAFDRVNWEFLFKTLTKFGYGEKFINIIKTLYNNITS